MLYRLIADFVLVIHLAYIAFVVGGLLVVLVGARLGWRCVHDFRFRILHLAAIGIVVLLVQLGIACPLTTIEARFRALAGQDHYANEGWMEYWLHELVPFDIPSWVFTSGYTLFGVAVLMTFLLIPPNGPHDNSGGSRPAKGKPVMLYTGDGR
jgi:hypothetical protein